MKQFSMKVLIRKKFKNRQNFKLFLERKQIKNTNLFLSIPLNFPEFSHFGEITFE